MCSKMLVDVGGRAMILGLSFFLVKSEVGKLHGCPWQLTIERNEEGCCCLHQICQLAAHFTKHISQTQEVPSKQGVLSYGYLHVKQLEIFWPYISAGGIDIQYCTILLLHFHLALQLRLIHPVHQ